MHLTKILLLNFLCEAVVVPLKSAMEKVREYLLPEMRVPFNLNEDHRNGTIRLACTHFLPFIGHTLEGSYSVLRGPTVVILQSILARTGFKNLTVVNAPDEIPVVNYGNGTYDGVLGRVQRGDAYFLLSPSVSTYERNGFLLGAPTLISNLELLVQKPQKVIDPFNFVKVFEVQVWVVLIASFMISSLCFYLVSHLLRFNERTFVHYLWIIFARLFPQEPLKKGDKWLRVFFALYFAVISVLLLNVLSGELTSTMAVRKEQDHIKNYADVLRFKRVRIYSEARSYLSHIFTNPRNELFRKLKKQHIPVTGTLSVPPSFIPRIEEVEKGTRAILGNENMLFYTIEKMHKHKKGKCPNLHVTSCASQLAPISILISRAIPPLLFRNIYKGVRTPFETGLHDVSLRWVQRKAYECAAHEDKTIKAIALDEIAGSFLVLAIGIALACIAFPMEICFEHWKL